MGETCRQQVIDCGLQFFGVEEYSDRLVDGWMGFIRLLLSGGCAAGRVRLRYDT
jgi:hypothetical protein